MKSKVIFKSEIRRPYRLINGQSHTNLSPLEFGEKVTGVYYIYDNDKKVRYIGFAGMRYYSVKSGTRRRKGNLKKTIIRHFESWRDREQVRNTYNRNTSYVLFIQTRSGKYAEELEKKLILRYNPPDNSIKYKLYREELKEKPQTKKFNFDDLESRVVPF